MDDKKPQKVDMGNGYFGTLESWPIDSLTPYELNVKKHEKTQVTKIALAITKFGFRQPIWVDRDGVIIAGHGRRLAAIELGWKKVPVLHSKDLWGDASRAARLADNEVARGDLDTEMLREEIATLDFDMGGIFDAKDLEFTKSDLGAMNEDVFVDDMGAVLEEQKREMDERTEAAIGDGVRIPLAKAFGFKDVAAGTSLSISKLMSKIEASTGLKNDEALAAYAREVTA